MDCCACAKVVFGAGLKKKCSFTPYGTLISFYKDLYTSHVFQAMLKQALDSTVFLIGFRVNKEWKITDFKRSVNYKCVPSWDV